MTIKHIVVSGGSHKYMISYGIIKKLYEEQFWNYSDIETIWATSSGTLISLFICLKYDFETLDDFIIKRPWSNLFKLKSGQILDMNIKNGIYDIDTLVNMVKPLLLGKNLSENSTLLDLYNYCKIETHFFTTEINTFKIIDMSYKTHPDVKLTDAMYMSSCIPGLCRPICENNNCYLDGGFMLNFPLDQCVSYLKCDKNDILGIYYESSYKSANINDKSSLLSLMHTIITKVIEHCNTNVVDYSEYVNVINCKTDNYGYDKIKDLMENGEARIKIINYGNQQAEEFLTKIKDM